MVALGVLREPCSGVAFPLRPKAAYAPIGCQTVLNSTNAVISDRC
jgi:hypothetical protein